MVFLLCQVSYVSKGINPSYVHEIYWTGDFVLKGFRIGVIASFLALTVSKNQAQFLYSKNFNLIFHLLKLSVVDSRMP